MLGNRAILKNEETSSLQPRHRLQESQREGPTSTSKAKSLQLDPSSPVPCFPLEKAGRSLGGRGIPAPGSSRLEGWSTHTSRLPDSIVSLALGGASQPARNPHTPGTRQACWLHLEPLALYSPIQKMRTKLARVTEEPLLTMLTRNWKRGQSSNDAQNNQLTRAQGRRGGTQGVSGKTPVL